MGGGSRRFGVLRVSASQTQAENWTRVQTELRLSPHRRPFPDVI